MPSNANPLLDTVETIRGYPSTLKIFKTGESRYWQVAAYLAGKSVRQSTKTTDKPTAIRFAKDFYDKLLLRKAQGQPLGSAQPNFEHIALQLIKEDQGRVERKDRKQSLVDDFQYIYEADLQPFFKRDHVRNINYQRIQEYVEHLHERNVSSKTIKNHFIQLNKILKHASKMELLDKLPIFPTISTQDNPREWFNDEQFTLLEKTIRKAVADKVKVRGVLITDELLDLTKFMVNTFLRPQDIKLLKNKDITVATSKKSGKPYLRIMAKGKVAASPVYSTPAAVTIYNRIKGDPDAYVFFPNLKSRNYAMSMMSKQFKYVLEQAGLYKTDNGARTLYSLRHTCITNQLVKGELSLALVAKNCRTSIEMIQRFYGSHAEVERNVHQLHEQIEAGDTLEEWL